MIIKEDKIKCTSDNTHPSMTMEWKNVLPADSDCDETDYYQDETDSCCEKTDHYEESTSDLEILESASQGVTRTSIEKCKEGTDLPISIYVSQSIPSLGPRSIPQYCRAIKKSAVFKKKMSRRVSQESFVSSASTLSFVDSIIVDSQASFEKATSPAQCSKESKKFDEQLEDRTMPQLSGHKLLNEFSDF